MKVPVLHRQCPVVLFSGSEAAVRAATVTSIQRFLGTCDACGVCTSCRLVAQRQWYQLVWLEPEEQGYTVDQLDEVLALLQFAQAEQERSVLVIERAEKLLSTSAQRLLAILEAPPAGWNFILLTSRPQDVLPTVVSRCIQLSCDETADVELTEGLESRYSWFCNPTLATLEQGWTEVATIPTAAIESRPLLDALVRWWAHQVREKGDVRSVAVLEVLVQGYSRLPQSGNVPYFWRILMLQITEKLARFQREVGR